MAAPRFLLALIAAALPVAAAAQQPSGLPPARDPHKGSACYRTSSSNTHYTPVDENTILVRDGNQAFRLGVNQCSNLRGINPVIVNVVRGTDMICAPIDLQMTVLDSPGGFPQPCIATSLTRIDDTEAKALSARARR